MEVHHHPQVENKRFKEYFFEFIMIFLAVTLGFFAESLREHLSDRSKEKEYILSYIEDLKHDTTELNSIIQFDSIKNRGLDSILQFSSIKVNDTASFRILFFDNLKYLDNLNLFKGSDIVIQQLKNSGNLRLIRKGHVADSIAAYDASVKDTYGQSDIYKSLFNDLQKIQLNMFDYTKLGDTAVIGKLLFTNMKEPLFNINQQQLKLFFNQVYAYKAVNKYYYKYLLRSELEFAKRMLLLLKKEYDI